MSARWSTPPLEGEAQQASQTLLSKWVAAEEAKRQTAAAKNDLEAYIIRMRKAVESSERILKVRLKAACVCVCVCVCVCARACVSSTLF